MSDNLKNLATLTIAEYTDRPGISVKVRFDPMSADNILNEEIPDSFKLMQYVFRTSLQDLAEASAVSKETITAPSTETAQ